MFVAGFMSTWHQLVILEEGTLIENGPPPPNWSIDKSVVYFFDWYGRAAITGVGHTAALPGALGTIKRQAE